MKLSISEKYCKYTNDDGYRIINAKIHEVLEGNIEKSTVTVCGYIPKLAKKEEILVTGDLEKHDKHGLNFKVYSYERPVPKTKEQFIAFLSSSLFKGIGRKIAEAIYTDLGKRAIETIGKKGVEALENINIPNVKKETIVDVIQQNFLLNDVIKYYTKLGIKTEQVIKLYQLEKDSSNLIDNPYLFAKYGILAYEFCDSIALSEGKLPHNFNRIETAILLMLKKEVRNGHCYVDEEKFINKVIFKLNQFKVQDDEVHHGTIINALLQTKVCVAEHGKIYPAFLYYAERDLADKIARMLNVRNKIYNSFQVDNFLFNEANQATDEQKLAVHTFMQNEFMVLTGDAGTGKTFTINLMLQAAKSCNPNAKIALAAPTGRAAKRIMESLTVKGHASTLHRLLGYGQNGQNDKPFYNRDNPLEYDIIIADEFSMADVVLAKNLLCAMKEGATLCISGDPDQLESVGAGSVLKDLLQTHVPHVHLTKIFRQNEKSKIIESGHLIKKGQMIDLKNHPSQYFIETHTPNILMYVIASIKKLLTQGKDINDIMVLSAMKAGLSGVIALNENIRELVNPASKNKRELSFGDVTLREGDKVMYLVNTPELNIFNGDIGVVHRINTLDGEIVLNFDSNIVTLPRKKLCDLTLAYATSVHKAQGNQSKYVIYIVSDEQMVALKRNIVYTALSRAEICNIIIGQSKCIDYAIRTTDKSLRNTNLANLITSRLKIQHPQLSITSYSI
ncbi:AAA family ATPase [Lysinibacillus sphaericus]|uniref:SF1B family DNA helicase RecD2 n=1 Tax=Lysinibacillus sphaericus TaxID=1421 RepID=UPI003F79281F